MAGGMPKLIATLGLTCALLLGAGCGGQSEEEKRQEARELREEREYRAQLSEYRQEVDERREEQAAYERCVDTLGELQDALKAVDSRLGVGLNYDDYGDEIGNVVVVYDNADFSEAGPECLENVGLKLERALRQYQRAAQVWDECFDDIDCDLDGIEDDLQVYWNRASTAMLGAEIGMEQMEPVSNPQKPRKPESLTDE